MSNTISPINTTIGAQLSEQVSDVSKAEKSFGAVISEVIRQASTADQQSTAAIHQFESGKAEHLHEVMLKLEEADLSLRMMVQMRNKAVAAYEEIMRMQI